MMNPKVEMKTTAVWTKRKDNKYGFGKHVRHATVIDADTGKTIVEGVSMGHNSKAGRATLKKKDAEMIVEGINMYLNGEAKPKMRDPRLAGWNVARAEDVANS